MAYLDTWEGSYSGFWYGSTIPDPPGTMRAEIQGRSSLTADLKPQQQKKKGGKSHRAKILKEDEELIHILAAYFL